MQPAVGGQQCAEAEGATSGIQGKQDTARAVRGHLHNLPLLLVLLFLHRSHHAVQAAAHMLRRRKWAAAPDLAWRRRRRRQAGGMGVLHPAHDVVQHTEHRRRLAAALALAQAQAQAQPVCSLHLQAHRPPCAA